MSHLAYVALGSNLASDWGSPAETVRSAVTKLNTLGKVESTSHLYLTDPVGNSEQPAFVNAAVSLRTPLTPHELIAGLFEMERGFGRNRLTSIPKGPRVLDLDLLFFDDVVLNSDELTIPHPELAGRRFVLQPMAEIAPTLVHPVMGLTIADLLAALPRTGPNGIAAVKRIP